MRKPAMSDTELTFAPVDQSNWTDLETLFEQRGGPHHCWCMAWRPMPAKDRRDKAAKKRELRSVVAEGIPIGLLAYAHGAPVGWCSVAPRQTFRPLRGGPGEESADDTWSITCFYISRSFRGTGVADRLIATAIAYARSNGARLVEAYPVARDSPSYRFMGFPDQFERAGFTVTGTAGLRRKVMQRRIG